MLYLISKLLFFNYKKKLYVFEEASGLDSI